MIRTNCAAKLAILEAAGISKTYLQGRVVALRDVSVSVWPGQSVAILGRSGSGKSTLLYSLCGLISPDNGTVCFEGKPVRSAADWTRLRAADIGIVFQDAWLLPTLTAAENVELPMIGLVSSASARRRRAFSLLEQVEVAHCADRLPSQLSGGERQRVGLARSLANKPKLVLADEPTGQLDTQNAGHMIELLLRLCHQDGVTLIIVTHDEDIAAKCDRQFVIVDGVGHLDAGDPGGETCSAG